MPSAKSVKCCDLFYFYIKPQQYNLAYAQEPGCDLFYFYIKPQLYCGLYLWLAVVTYSISTSNHNLKSLALL